MKKLFKLIRWNIEREKYIIAKDLEDAENKIINLYQGKYLEKTKEELLEFLNNKENDFSFDIFNLCWDFLNTDKLDELISYMNRDFFGFLQYINENISIEEVEDVIS